jgi:protein-S-isoprenylcysteine O-methyltransferase Ste14
MPPIHLAAAIAAMAVLHETLPIMRLFFTPWRWLGLIPLIAGILLAVWARLLFKKHQTTIKPGEVSNRLVTEGPFRFSRNPIYVGMVLVLAGAAILFGSLSPWLMIPIFIGVIARNVIPVEESMLREKFGAEYQQYQASVRRWL